MMEYKATKIKMAVKLLGSEDLVMKMVREFDETAEELGRRFMVKKASKCTEELSIELNLEQPQPIGTEVSKCQVEKLRGGSDEPEMAREPGHSQVRGPELEHRSLLLVVNIMEDLPKPHKCCHVSTVRTALTNTAASA